jgi:hypothetical protein
VPSALAQASLAAKRQHRSSACPAVLDLACSTSVKMRWMKRWPSTFSDFHAANADQVAAMR